LISSELKTLAAPFERNTKIIWFAFTFAPVIYAALAWFTTQGGEKQLGNGQLPAEAIYIAILIAVVSGIGEPWLIVPRFLNPRRIMQGGNVKVPAFGESAPAFERLGDRDRERAAHLGAIQQYNIIRWAGAESVAIFGLMALFTGVTNLYGAWAFMLASIILLVMLRPDFERDLEIL